MLRSRSKAGKKEKEKFPVTLQKAGAFAQKTGQTFGKFSFFPEGKGVMGMTAEKINPSREVSVFLQNCKSQKRFVEVGAKQRPAPRIDVITRTRFNQIEGLGIPPA